MDEFYNTILYEFEAEIGNLITVGFDTFVGFMDHRDAHVYFHGSLIDVTKEDILANATGRRDSIPPFVEDVIKQDLFQIKEGQRYPTAKDDCLADVYIHEALKHMEGLYTDGRGNSIFPETPFEEHKNENGIYFRKVLTPRAALARMITRFDTQVGWIVDKLKALGVYDETIIILPAVSGIMTSLTVMAE